MLKLPIPASLQQNWKIVVTIDADEDDTHEWITAELRRGNTSYPLDSVRRQGEVIEIVEVDDDEIPEILKAFEAFKERWMLYALELGLPFEIDAAIQDWLGELTPHA
jgi:hypothetical protein